MKKYKLWTYDIVFYNDDIFFSATQFNGLFKAKMSSGEAQLINSFPKDMKTGKRLHSAAIRYKNEILFLPDLSHYIALYNIDTNSFDCIDFPIKKSDEVMPFCPLISTAILIGTCVYAFGSRYPCIICYDFETRHLKVYDKWFEEFKKYGYKENTAFFRLNVYQMNHSVVASTFHNNALVELDLETEQIIFHPIKRDIQAIIHSDDCVLWLLTEGGRQIDSWNKSGGLTEMEGIGKDLKKIGGKIHCCADMSNEIWMFSYLYGQIYVIDKKSGQVIVKDLIGLENDERYQNNNLGTVWFCKRYENKLYFMSVIENKLYCFSDRENEEFCIDIYTDKAKMDKYLFQDQEFPSLKHNYKEEKADFLWRFSYDLDDWLDILAYAKSYIAKQEKTEIKYGEKIYRFLK